MDRLSPADSGRPVAAPPRMLVGTAPVNWNNQDLPATVRPVPFPAILDEMVAAGYAGTEHDAVFPADPAPVRAALAARGLQLCGCYTWLDLLAADGLAAQRDGLARALDVLAAFDCPHLIVSAPMTAARIALAGHVPADGSAGLTDAQWDRLGQNLAAAAALAAARGIRTHYHNHVGTVVETPAEVERLIACLDAAGADLCFDTGHYAYGGGDPNAFVARHRRRIGHVHLKDVDPAILAQARREGWSFREALRHFIFCELGHGLVDLPGIVDALRDADYAGWLVVEQDTTPRPPTASATANRAYLRDRCGL